VRLVTWNIQCGKGCDGVVDLARIVSVAKSLADSDIFCFQEVADGFGALVEGADQSNQLAALLPDHRPVFRPAVETNSQGRFHRFGNMTLSRLPILQVASHLLPWPRTGVPRSMRRLALEVTVHAMFGPVRIVNTHLEFHSGAQREAQILRLLDLQEEASTDPKFMGENHVDPYGSPDGRFVQRVVRGLQFRRFRSSARDASRFVAARTELSRCMEDLPFGPTPSPDLRPLR
jgi:endonuclease/exonuclease/phosphatase family metal-dependent hydrolase